MQEESPTKIRVLTPAQVWFRCLATRALFVCFLGPMALCTIAAGFELKLPKNLLHDWLFAVLTSFIMGHFLWPPSPWHVRDRFMCIIRRALYRAGF